MRRDEDGNVILTAKGEERYGRKLLAATRRDLLSEFQMPDNTPYLKLAEMLIQARAWLVSDPPSTKEEARALVKAEMFDRYRRLASIQRIQTVAHPG